MKKLYIIKIGGNVIDNPIALEQFLMELAKIDALKILVHGGGKLATELAKRLGVSQAMVKRAMATCGLPCGSSHETS